MNALVTITSAQTMSSREIAELTRKDHKNVIRDIRAMLDALKEDGSDLSHVREDKDLRGYTSAFHLDRELTETLLTGYSVPLRRKVIARWHELEAMATAATAIPAQLSRLQLIEMAMQAEQERLVLEDKASKLEAKVAEQAPKVAFAQQVEVAPDAIDVGKAAKLIGTGRTRLMAFMREIRWINRFNQPYQDKIEAGLLDVKVLPWDHPDHGLQQRVTTLVMGKGLVKLQFLWSERQHAIGVAHMQPAATQPGPGAQA